MNLREFCGFMLFQSCGSLVIMTLIYLFIQWSTSSRLKIAYFTEKYYSSHESRRLILRRCQLLNSLSGHVLSFGSGKEPNFPCIKQLEEKIEGYNAVDINYNFEDDIRSLDLSVPINFFHNISDVEDESMDGVISGHVLSSLVDVSLDHVLDEYDRVLKPKGRLYLFEHFQDEKDVEEGKIRYYLQIIMGFFDFVFGGRKYTRGIDTEIKRILEEKNYRFVEWDVKVIKHLLIATDPHIIAVLEKRAVEEFQCEEDSCTQ